MALRVRSAASGSVTDAHAMQGGVKDEASNENERRDHVLFFVKTNTGKLIPVRGVAEGGEEMKKAYVAIKELRRIAGAASKSGRAKGCTAIARYPVEMDCSSRTAPMYEEHDNDASVCVGIGEIVEVCGSARQGEGLADGSVRTWSHRYFPYVTFIKPDNTKVSLNCTIMHNFLDSKRESRNQRG